MKLVYRFNKSDLILVQLFISLVLVILVQCVHGARFFDDAYITFRYARNISQGFGFIYNLNQSVLGTTSPLFTLLLAGIASFAGPEFIPGAAFALSLLADALNVWLIYRITTWIMSDRIVALLISGAFLFHPLRIDVAAGGMETSLFITFLLLMYERYLLGNRSNLTGLWAGLAFLTRPDAVIAILPLGIDWMLRDFKGIFRPVVVFCISVMPWLVWAAVYFGNPIPQSIIAKGTLTKPPIGSAAYYLFTFITTGSVGPYPGYISFVPGVILLTLVTFLGGYSLYKIKSAAVIVGGYPVFYVFIMSLVNPAMHYAWYYPPLIFGLLLLFTSPLQYLRKRFSLTTCRISIGLLSLVLIAVPAVLMSLFPNWPLARSREAAFWSACSAVEKTVQPGQIVLAPDIGIIGWCLPQADILDVNGLVSPQMTNYPPGISMQLLSTEQPDYIISLDQFLDRKVVESPEFMDLYSQFWRQEVTIAGSSQGIRIYQKSH